MPGSRVHVLPLPQFWLLNLAYVFDKTTVYWKCVKPCGTQWWQTLNQKLNYLKWFSCGKRKQKIYCLFLQKNHEFGDFMLLFLRGPHMQGHCELWFCFSCFKWRQINANSQVWSLLFLEWGIVLNTNPSLNVACISIGVLCIFRFLTMRILGQEQTKQKRARGEAILNEAYSTCTCTYP